MRGMKRAGKQLRRICAATFLLFGLLSVSAMAAGAGELQIDLSYTGVTGSDAGVTNGSPVSAGYAALLEDGTQVAVDGKLLTEITSGSVLFHYSFDPAKSYAVEIQEGLTAPYYKAKTIAITPQQVADAIAAGTVVTDTVEWVEWSKPIKVTVEDAQGNPAPKGTQVTLVATDKETYQTLELTKSTNDDGMAVFYDFSYDSTDPDMCNVHDDCLFVSAKCGDTTIAQFYDLTVTGNCVSLSWPDATVSGIVRNAAGQPAANQRVAAYSGLPVPASDPGDRDSGDLLGDYWQGSEGITFHFHFKGTVFYTVTDANGRYTLSLPRGESATVCVDDTNVNSSAEYGIIGGWLGGEKYPIFNYDYAAKASQHFTWIRRMFEGTETFSRFQGIQCLETAPAVCIPYGNLSGVDLTMGRNGYTLKGAVQAGGEPFSGNIYIKLLNADSVSKQHLHKGAIAETSVNWNITNGEINKTAVKLVPGTYSVSISPVMNSQKDLYSGYETATITIPASGVSAGMVDLKTLNFVPVPKPPMIYVPGKPSDITTPCKPFEPSAGHGYVVSRLEKVEDPAYGGSSYQITLRYTAFHTNSAVNQVDNVTFTVKLPAGITVNHSGGMTQSGTSADGIVLTKYLASIPTGQTDSIVFSVKVEDSSPANYYAITCHAAVDPRAEELSSMVTLQRLRINLSAPRLVSPGTTFTAFGDITGAGEAGVKLYRDGSLAAAGAKKGRYYYFQVPGQAAGSYLFQAQTDRSGTVETSNAIAVDVASGLPQVKDVYIKADGVEYPKNARFNMVYYTGFVNAGDLSGSDFEVFVKVDGITPNTGITLEAMGKSYPAAYDSSSDCWKATISGYTGYGDYDLMLTIDGVYTTQIGRLLFLF